MRTALTLLIALLVAPLFAETTISGKDTYAAYERIVLTATVDAPEGAKATITWDHSDDMECAISGNSILIWAKPGTYDIRANYLLTKVIKVGDQSVEVVVAPGIGTIRKKFVIKEPEGSPPAPTPTPDPKPKPDETKPPATPVEGAWVVIVEETADRSPNDAVIMGSALLTKELESRGIKYRAYDIDAKDCPPQTKSLANSIGLPALLILAKDGKPLATVKRPSSVEELDKVIKSTLGR